jgi:hypothetical protein
MSDYNDFGAVAEPTCPRCGIGVDDDGDGDCPVCASASNRLITYLVAVRAHLRRTNKDLHDLRIEHDKLQRSKRK